MTAVALLGFSFHIVIYALFLRTIIKPKYMLSGMLFVLLSISTRYLRIILNRDNLLLDASVEPAIVLFLIVVLYEAKIAQKFFTFGLILFIGLITEILIYITLSALYGFELSGSSNLTFPDIPSMLIGNVIFLIVILLTITAWKLYTGDIETNQMSLFMFFPLSQIYPIIIIVLMAGYYNFNTFLGILYISTFLCILANAGLIIAMKKLTSLTLLNKKLDFYEKQLELQLNHYEQLSKYISIIRKDKHDMKNHVQTIYTLLENKDSRVKQYTDNLALSIDSTIINPFCDNLIVDALLQNKYSLAKNNNINMKVTVQLEDEDAINNLHLCSIFSNLIDNALEACQNISDPNITPFIIINCYKKGGFLLINIKNSKQNIILTSKNKKLLTTKSNTLEHGIGLTIVGNTVKIYDGKLLLDYSDYEFNALAALNLEVTESSTNSLKLPPFVTVPEHI